MSLSSPADITGTFNNTNYNNGNSSGAITYEGHTASGITDSNKYYYNLKPSVSNETHWIYFDASSNRWYDYGNGDPTCFQVNNAGTPFINPTTVITGGDTIQIRDGGLTSSYGNPIFTFTHPSYLIGVSGGTSTEEVFVPDAKIVNYGGVTGLRFEQRGYPAASYELTGPGLSSTWTLTSQSNNLQHHISNLSSGTYYLWQDSVQVATLIASDNKKVFRNFW